MVTTPTKDLAARGEKLASPERTIATELPDELSRLPGPFGSADVTSVSSDRGRKKSGRSKKAPTATGFVADDSHPTILAAGRPPLGPR